MGGTGVIPLSVTAETDQFALGVEVTRKGLERALSQLETTK